MSAMTITLRARVRCFAAHIFFLLLGSQKHDIILLSYFFPNWSHFFFTFFLQWNDFRRIFSLVKSNILQFDNAHTIYIV